MRNMLAVFVWLSLCVPGAFAQAVPAGRVGAWDVSVGYSYLNHPVVGESFRSGLNGIDADFTMRLSSRVALQGDFGYARSGNLFQTSSHSSVASYLAGPVFFPAIHRRYDLYVRALFGGARVAGPIPVPGGVLIGGWDGHFAWAVGGGFDYQLFRAFAFRGGLDYMRTAYFGPSLLLQGQSNIRATAAIVYAFAPLRRRRG